MATTAHAVPRLEVTATDDMDLHSDGGLDFEDGDIELDLDPAPPAQRQDDDVSIKDAATDAGLDTQTVTADQDDFMLDHEEYYEENAIQYDDITLADPAPASNSGATQTAVLAPPDEDLIDYSDDEDEQVPSYLHKPSDQDLSEVQTVQEHTLEIPAKYAEDQLQKSGSVVSKDDVTPDQQDYDQDDGVGIYETLYQPDIDQGEFEADKEGKEHTEDSDGGVELQDLAAQTNSNEHQDEDHQDRPASETRSITVNYESNELWLFKGHDTEESGDWLLEDISVIHSSLSELLQACRASLGEDISHETELGLRFDHLHNMELYEDNTACVAVSLERLLDLYHTLHSQDGNNEPESFYMCLLSRPRFATLLSDVAKHAEQGSGYSGFNSAVAAGETHFVDAYSGHSTEHDGTEWENEEEEEQQQQHEGTESPSGAEDGAGHAEHQEQDDDAPGCEEGEEPQEETGTEPDNRFIFEDTAHSEHISQDGKDSPALENADASEEVAEHDETQEKTTQRVLQSASKQQIEQIDNDRVDYSDANEPEDAKGPQTAVEDAPSPSSSTVQGDDPPIDEDTTQIAESTKLAEDHTANIANAEDVDLNAGAGDDTHLHTEEQLGHTDNAESYQDYDQAYNEEDPFPGFQMGATNSYSAESDFDGFTNQDYTGYDYQDVDQQLQNDFLSGGDFDGSNAGESANTADNFANRDDYLDLTDAPEWATDQGPMPQRSEDVALVYDDFTEQDQEEEDGVVEQPAVAASSAADPVAASSTDLQETSPQGQKRSIDEVGDLVGDALDSIDTKRPRV